MLIKIRSLPVVVAPLVAVTLAGCSSSHSSSPQSISVTAQPTPPTPAKSDDGTATFSAGPTSSAAPSATPSTAGGTAPANPAAAETQIKAAFTGAFDKPPGSARYFALGFVENGDQLRGAVDRVIARFPNAGHDITVTLGAITFTSPDSAAVVFTPRYSGAAPYGTHTGEAVFAGGRWQVTQETFCGLIRYGGVACP
jgi:biotin carboxyl carrier protein